MIRFLMAIFVTLTITAARADDIRVAVTTSFENSGLADLLLPHIAADTGLDVQLLVVGTGQALRLGAAGDVDAVLVHARDAELVYIADGHATHRTPIMYNDFVIIGPQDDPAGIRNALTAADAMATLQTAQAPFVSRGDDSGTHKAERALWADDTAFGPWYRAVGAGMGAALNTASAMDAYIVADRASWLNFRNKGNLTVLFDGDPALFNQYAYLPVTPSKGAVRHDRALRLEAWLLSATARDLINGYKIADTQLFVFNGN